VQASSHIKGAAEFDGGIRVAPLRKKGVTPTWRIPEPSGRFALSLIDRRWQGWNAATGGDVGHFSS
jgi:hypothetical protein